MYVISSIVPFDMIMDVDLGLWKIIQEKYHNNNYFSEMTLNMRNMNTMKYIITQRNKVNPLSVLLNTKSLNQSDDIYDLLMEEEYDNILSRSVKTGIFNMIRRSYGVKDVLKFTIICKNQKEKQLILDNFSKYKIEPNVIVSTGLSSIDTSSCGNIYVKEFEDILEYNEVEGKNIIVGRYGFNFENGSQELPNIEISKQLLPTNVIQLIDIHAINENILPVG